MDLYSVRNSGALKLKGEKKKHKKSKKRKREEKHDEEGAKIAKKAAKSAKQAFREDRDNHNGWWNVTEFKEIVGPIAIEIGDHCYVKALDDGSFTIGAMHEEGQGPDQEEILMAIKINDTKIALKSGYNKYMKVQGNGQVLGISDAVGAMEQLEPIFQDGQLALLGANSKFISLDEESETVECKKLKAGPSEMIKIRSQAEREEDKEVYVPEEEKGKIGQVELNYVKKFQKFQDHKIRLNMDDRTELVKAKTEGYLHEALLDRRAKMKADRYCK